MSRLILNPKTPDESKNYVFDFTALVAPGVTITPQVTCTVYSGVDSGPGLLIATPATVANGTVVTQLVTGGVLGTIYSLVCAGSTSDGQTLDLSGYLAVIPAAP